MKELTVIEVELLCKEYGYSAVIEDGQVTRLEREVKDEVPEGSNEAE